MAKRIIVAVILMPIMLWIMLVPPPLAWTVLVCFISAMAAFELLRAVGEGKITLPMKVVTITSAALIPFGSWAGLGMAYVNLLSFVVTAVCFWCAIRAYDEDGVKIGFPHVLETLFAGIIIPLGLSALVELRRVLYRTGAGGELTCTVLREGRELEISFPLTDSLEEG